MSSTQPRIFKTSPFHWELPENRDKCLPSQSGASPRSRKGFLQIRSCTLRAWPRQVHHQTEVLLDGVVPPSITPGVIPVRVYGVGKGSFLFETDVSQSQPGPHMCPTPFYPQVHLQLLASKLCALLRVGGLRTLPPSSNMAAPASVTGPVTWTASPMRSPGPGRRLSLPGPHPESATALVNRSLSDHGNGLGRGARGSGCGGSGSLVAGRRGGAAEAQAAALALAPAVRAMLPGSPERELTAWWEAEAVDAAKAQAAKDQVRVDPGAAGEPERKAGEEQPKEPAPGPPSAAEEGDARVPPRPPRTVPVSRPKPAPAPAQGLCPHGKSRSKGRSCKRSSNRSNEYCSLRPVTVDSSKARTSLDALKISIRQLKWKEVRPGPPRGHRGVDWTGTEGPAGPGQV